MYKKKTPYQIVSDPFSTEQEWTEALAAIGIDEKQIRLKPARAPQGPVKSPGLITFVQILAVSLSSTALVKVSYDWGYRVVEAAFGQPSAQAGNQGVMALFSVAHIVLPVCLAVVLSTLVKARQATKLVTLLLFSMLGTLAWDFGIFRSSGDFAEQMAGCAVTALSALTSYWLANLILAKNRKIFSERLSALSRPVVLTLSFSAGVCLAVSFLNDFSRYLLPLEILWYAGTIFMVGYLSNSSARDFGVQIRAGLLVLAPIFVCNLINIAANLVSLFLDTFGAGASLGWRALLSAILINVVAYTSLVLAVKLKLKHICET